MDRLTRRSRSRSVALVVAVVTGLGLGLTIDVVRSGGPAAWLARHHVSIPYTARGERLDIGGRALYLDCRGAGRPTVVLEAGMGADSATWSAVIDEIATTTRTCAYDRAGRGRSDPIARHTLSDATTDLADLVDLAGEPGPYVLVGHSLGGTYVRVFAASNRADVAGIVLVDSFDPDIQSAVVHPLLGLLRAEYEADLDGLRDVASRVESLDWPASETQLRAASIAGLSIEVLVAPRAEPRLDGVQNARIADASRAAYEALSPGLVR